MASIYDLKPRFQSLLRPIVKRLASAGVTANQVTIAAIVLSVLGGLAIVYDPAARWPLLLIPFILFVRMALNAIDGMLAREHDQKTAFGAVLNELGDVVSDAALYLPFALISGISAWWIIVIVILSILSEMTGVIGVQIGASRRYDGPMGKSDRALLFGALALYFGLGFAALPYMNVFFAAIAGLLVLTITNRVRKALEELS